MWLAVHPLPPVAVVAGVQIVLAGGGGKAAHALPPAVVAECFVGEVGLVAADLKAAHPLSAVAVAAGGWDGLDGAG